MRCCSNCRTKSGLPCVLKKSGLVYLRIEKRPLFLCCIPYCNTLDVILPTVEVMCFLLMWCSTVAAARPFSRRLPIVCRRKLHHQNNNTFFFLLTIEQYSQEQYNTIQYKITLVDDKKYNKNNSKDIRGG